MAEKLPEIMRIKDVAARYGVHRDTIRKWVEDGKFPRPLRLPGKHPAWRADTIDEWERERAATPARA